MQLKRQNIIFILIVLTIHFIFLSSELKKIELAEFKPTPERIRVNLAEILPKQKQKKEVRQIVRTEEKTPTQKPKDAKYLSRTNQQFDRQTVAKSVGIFKKAGKGDSTKKQVSVSSSQQAQPKQAKSKRQPRGKNGKISFADLAAKNVAAKQFLPKRSHAARGIKSGSFKEKGLAQNNDFVEDIPMGDMTRLNTQEFKYYGFYHRIRLKLEQYWENSIKNKVESIYKAGRRVASDQNKITALRIVLDDRGNIVNVAVKSSSGVKELDDAAIESFNRAGPFPNPPRGMIKNGFATIDWGFVVKS